VFATGESEVEAPAAQGRTGAPAAQDETVPPPPAAPSSDVHESSPRDALPGDAGEKPLAAPAVRARARALGIDLETVSGTGIGGRILHADLDALLTEGRGHILPPPAFAAREGVEEVKVIGLRKQIAENMREAKRRIPHFSYVEEVDVTALEASRRDLNEDPGGKPKLTVLPFLIRALVHVLPDHPGINAHFDDEAALIRRHSAVHVGVATQTRRGLLVPVIRHAETLDLYGLAAAIARLSEAARSGKASREELSGSTVTVSSLGVLGGIVATPIIKPPEVAIIGVNKIAEQARVRDGKIVVRKIMNLSSSFDHRVVDGFDAAAFIHALKSLLEAPARLLSRNIG
jgi:2-oxoisovalerate dehydrogenase E2 component (dihydrolipoyl transacylase)